MNSEQLIKEAEKVFEELDIATKKVKRLFRL